MGNCMDKKQNKKDSAIPAIQQFKAECGICFNEYNNDARAPMSLSCFHTICKECLNSISNKKCPFDNKPILNSGKNYQFVSLIEHFKGKKIKTQKTNIEKEDIKKNQSQNKERQPAVLSLGIRVAEVQTRLISEVDGNMQRIRPPNRIFEPRILNPRILSPLPLRANPCQASHTFSFLSYQVKCGSCQSIARCWQCQVCRIKKCLTCNQTRLDSDKCPNNHPTKWVNTISKCTKCSQILHGKNCVQCSYSICDDCSKIKFTKICPNKHQTKWVSYKDKCVKCKVFNRGYHCIKCSYHYCDFCQNTNFKKDLCPNNHNTIQRSIRSTCTKCGQIQSGMSCSSCLYHICNKCF